MSAYPRRDSILAALFACCAAAGCGSSSPDPTGEATPDAAAGDVTAPADAPDLSESDTPPADAAPTDAAADAAPDLVSPEGCTVGSKDCGDQAYCLVPKGQCAQKGTCTPRPTDCPKVDEPVCACGGGGSFSSACLAAMDGFSADHDGDCMPALPGSCKVGDNSTCGADGFCQGLMGQCSGEGSCVQTTGQLCASPFPSVCGCDGKTYADECEAAQKGQTNVAYYGPCEGTQLCHKVQLTMFKPCPEGTFCVYSNDMCSAEYGTCQPPPATCPTDASPVCGCNGVNYANACLARQAGSGVKFKGDCTVYCTVGDNSKCKASEFCQGYCGQQGVCVDRPKSCTGNVFHVCACDGKTYKNSCEAKKAGASFDHNGPCG